MDHARNHPRHDFYVEENVPVSLLQANFIMESQAYEEVLKKLTMKNTEIMEELTNQWWVIELAQWKARRIEASDYRIIWKQSKNREVQEKRNSLQQ